MEVARDRVSELPAPDASSLRALRAKVRAARFEAQVTGPRFAASARIGELADELASRRFVVARAPETPRGGLRKAIDDAVEGALALRGALPSATSVDAPLEAIVRDQVFRARALGAAGLGVTVPALARVDGVVDLDDGAALLTWLAAAREAPIAIVLEEIDRDARVLAPLALTDLVAPRAEPPRAPVRLRPVPVADRDIAPEPEPAPEPAPEPEPEPAPEPAPEPEPEPAPEPEPEPEPAPEPAPALASAPAPSAVPPAVTSDVRRVVDSSASRAHAMELEKARGPKPVSAIEKLFVQHYVPLLGAIARGEADGAVRSIVDEWRAQFEHSWREGFAAVRVTGKRPPMVFDAFDVAAKVARLNGARAVKLILVDAMRFDLGERVEGRLASQLAGHAVAVDHGLLWAAAPTTTPAQMALLSRGQDALRDLPPESEPEPDVSRGRAVATLRRERAGSRELLKLDLVEARLRGQGPAFDVRMDRIADEVADVLARHLAPLPPRTLAFVFGDHGFRMAPTVDGRGTTGASQGGLSPEEVLVPAQAWLVGGVH
jgi:hypothetical protein